MFISKKGLKPAQSYEVLKKNKRIKMKNVRVFEVMVYLKLFLI